jgi:hypothetical protein
VEIYLFEMGIEFIPSGNATRESETKGVSFEPDESYYSGDRKPHPDLAIEADYKIPGFDARLAKVRVSLDAVGIKVIEVYRLMLGCANLAGKVPILSGGQI